MKMNSKARQAKPDSTRRALDCGSGNAYRIDEQILGLDLGALIEGHVAVENRLVHGHRLGHADGRGTAIADNRRRRGEEGRGRGRESEHERGTWNVGAVSSLASQITVS